MWAQVLLPAVPDALAERVRMSYLKEYGTELTLQEARDVARLLAKLLVIGKGDEWLAKLRGKADPADAGG
jgi:hypothetical protein